MTLDYRGRPFTSEQCLHVRAQMRAMLHYLDRLRRALAARGHDRRHLYYRLVVEAQQSASRLHDASLYAAHTWGFSVPDGTLCQGTTLFDARDPEQWQGDGI